MDFSDPRQRAVFFDLHSGLPREGPGDRATVQRALDLMTPRPDRPAVLDIACGPGGQTLDLAELLPGARITAVDLNPAFLRDLQDRARARGLEGSIDALRGDMAALPFEPGAFDILWCEGAAYILGVARALQLWRPLLKPGGHVGLSEPIWLSDQRPAEARAFWTAYPEMTDASHLRERARGAGYAVVGDFVLSEDAWWNLYYRPLEARIRELAPRYGGDEIALRVLEEARIEIECYRRYSDSYGYLFLVLRKEAVANSPGP